MRVVLAVLLLLWSQAAGAQESAARVDYIAGRTLYLQVADGRFWRTGDSVRVGRTGVAEWSGRLRIIAATDRRVAGEWESAAIPFAIGDSVRVEHGPSADSMRAARDTLPRGVTVGAAPSVSVPATPAGVRRGVRATGSTLFDVDMMHTSSPGSAAARTRSSIAPGLRLRGNVSGLPGDIRFSTTMRGVALTDNSAAPGEAALHVYELEAAKDWRYVQLRAGRFWHPHEPYAGFVDGGLVRLGARDGAGAGLVYGYEPVRGTEGFSSATARVTAFADAHGSSGAARWDIDVSAHRARSNAAGADTAMTRAYFGTRGTLSAGQTSLSQTLRVDRHDAEWIVSILDVSATTALTPSWFAGARFSTERGDIVWRQPWLTGRWHRGSANLMWLGTTATAGADIGATWTASDSSAVTESTALTLSGWLDVPLSFATVELTSYAWLRGETTVVQLAPAVRLSIGATRVRAGYRIDAARLAPGTQLMHGAHTAVELPVRGAELDVRVQHDRGGGISTTRLSTGLWLRW